MKSRENESLDPSEVGKTIDNWPEAKPRGWRYQLDLMSEARSCHYEGRNYSEGTEKVTE